MRRCIRPMNALVLIALFFIAGCSTCPQADFMDTFCKSRNACAPPGAVVVPAAPAPASPCGHCGKAGCRHCNPFRLFHRNRGNAP